MGEAKEPCYLPIDKELEIDDLVDHMATDPSYYRTTMAYLNRYVGASGNDDPPVPGDEKALDCEAAEAAAVVVGNSGFGRRRKRLLIYSPRIVCNSHQCK